MPRVKVYGYRSYDFADEKDPSRRLQGVSFHVAELSPSSSYGFVGSEVRKISISQNVIDSWGPSGYFPAPGDECEVLMNLSGRPTGFLPVEPTK